MRSSKGPRGWLLRIARGAAYALVALIMLVGLLGAAGLVAYQHAMHTTPIGLYEYAWRATQELAFDQQSLGNWQSFEHKYDAQIKTDEDAVKDANEMLDTLHDPFTRLLSRSETEAEHAMERGSFAGVGIQFSVKIDNDGNAVKNQSGQPLLSSTEDGYPLVDGIIEGSPAQAAGIRAGDALLSVNGESLQNMGGDTVISRIRGPAGTTLNLVIRRGSQQLPLAVVRANVQMHAVKALMVGGDIGYIRLNSFEQDSTVAEMRAALRKLSAAKGYVIDLRNNPGGLVGYVLQLVPMFLDQGTIVTIKEHIPGGGTQSTTYKVAVGSSANLTGNKPIIILINGKTASAAEMFTGALANNHRAEAVGTTTFGKGIGQSVIPAPNGTELHVTSLRYYTPDGSWLGDGNLHKHGITPSFMVPAPDTFEPLSDEDVQLKFAIDRLHARLSGSN